MSTQTDHEQASPTARDPWTAMLCWARGQNLGRVSLFPNRTPVVEIVDRLRSGETFSDVALDFDVQIEAVHLLWQLSLDLKEHDARR